MLNDTPRLKRPIVTYDFNGHVHVRFLEQLFGSQELEKRLRQVEREIRSEHGTYLQNWVLPNRSFWLGLGAARDHVALGNSLAGSVTEQMERPMETAAKLMVLRANMPQATLQDFATRLLSADYLEPVLHEIDLAAHFWQLGYQIDWFVQNGRSGVRIPEFVARDADHEFDVECKTHGTDSGRRISRPRIYKLFDAILDHEDSTDLTGKIDITVPGELPAGAEWVREVVAAIYAAREPATETRSLADGTAIQLELHRMRGLLIPSANFDAEVAKLRTPFAHVAVRAKRDDHGMVLSPLTVRVASRSDDQVVNRIFKDVRHANHQLSGQRAGFISCFIPEIESFEGMDKDWALAKMTAIFFDQHADRNVYAVGYSSSGQRSIAGNIISMSNPAIIFKNPLYDRKFGDDFPVSAT